MPTSLMAPTVGSSQGVTNRLNGIESNLSGIDQTAGQIDRIGGQIGQMTNQLLRMHLAAHQASNEALVLDYTNRLHKETSDIFNQLKTKTNKDAIDARPKVLDAFNQAQTRLSEELKDKDPYVVNTFRQNAQSTIYDAQAKADAYIMEQSIKYRDTERAAQIANIVELYAGNIENPVLAQKYKSELQAARTQQNNELGIENGSETDKAAYRALLTPVSQSQVDKYVGLKQFSAALDALHGFYSAGEITNDAYNDALVEIVRAQETARRQAEVDYMRRVRFENSQVLAAEKLKTEKLKQDRYIYAAEEQAIKDLYGPLTPTEQNARRFYYADIIEKDPNAYRGYEDNQGQWHEYTPEQRKAIIYQVADSLVRKDVRDRDMAATVANINYDALAVLERHGSGDAPADRIKNAFANLAQGRELEGMPYEALRNAFDWWQQTGTNEGELNAMLQLRQTSRQPEATALAFEVIESLAARGELPLDRQGRVDQIQLGLILHRRGIENYDYSKASAAAEKYAKQQITALEKDFNNPALVHDRENFLMNMGAKALELDSGTYGDFSDFISFDPNDATGKRKELYDRGRGVVARVALYLKSEAKTQNFESAADMQSWFLTRASQSDVIELIQQYMAESLYQWDNMDTAQRNAYENAEIARRLGQGE